jgi:hypothetical protein
VGCRKSWRDLGVFNVIKITFNSMMIRNKLFKVHQLFRVENLESLMATHESHVPHYPWNSRRGPSVAGLFPTLESSFSCSSIVGAPAARMLNILLIKASPVTILAPQFHMPFRCFVRRSSMESKISSRGSENMAEESDRI